MGVTKEEMVSIILNSGLLKITGYAFLVCFPVFLSSTVPTEGGSAMEVVVEKTGNNSWDDKRKAAVPALFFPIYVFTPLS